MRPETVLAIAFNRGLRPVVREDVLGPRLEWAGGKPSPALQFVLDHPHHAAAVLELCKGGYVPPTVTEVPRTGADEHKRDFFPDGTDYFPERPKPGPFVPEFDHAAETALRALYSAGVGLLPRVTICVKTGEPRIDWECRVSPGFKRDAALVQIEAARPLKPRIMAHLLPRPTGAFSGTNFETFDPGGGYLCLEWRNSRRPDGHGLRKFAEMHETKDVRHPFCLRPGVQYDAFRWSGEVDWRALWGRWVTNDSGKGLKWVPWGL